MKLNKDQKAEMKARDLLGEPCDLSLEPHVLTDKPETKTVGCRDCGRPCIVTRFASVAKVACLDHRDRHAKVEVIQKLDASKEPHVLTDKDETKTVPCRNCGRPCIVTRFASAAKVACNDCRKTAPAPKRTSTINKDSNGRMRETITTEFANTKDLQWSEFITHQPFDIQRIWTDEEKEEHNTCIQESMERKTLAKIARKKIIDLEYSLSKVGQDKAEKIEAEIYDLDIEATSQQDIAKEKRERANILARVAFIRGALDRRYQLKEVDNRMCLIRGETQCRIPTDFLDTAQYAKAKEPIKEKVAV